MIKRFSGQEIFIILAAIAALLFMYMALIMADNELNITIYDSHVDDEHYIFEQNLITKGQVPVIQVEQTEIDKHYLAYSADYSMTTNENTSGE